MVVIQRTVVILIPRLQDITLRVSTFCFSGTVSKTIISFRLFYSHSAMILKQLVEYYKVLCDFVEL
jgi:hypothetical protein